MGDDADRRDALADLAEMKRREAAAWRRVAERKYPSVLVHAQDDLAPVGSLTMCGKAAGRVATLPYPLPSLAAISCPDCRQRIRECEEEGNP